MKIAITGLRDPNTSAPEEGPPTFLGIIRRIAGAWAKEPLELHPIYVTFRFPDGKEVVGQCSYEYGELLVTIPAPHHLEWGESAAMKE